MAWFNQCLLVGYFHHLADRRFPGPDPLCRVEDKRCWGSRGTAHQYVTEHVMTVFDSVLSYNELTLSFESCKSPEVFGEVETGPEVGLRSHELIQ